MEEKVENVYMESLLLIISGGNCITTNEWLHNLVIGI